ncbi:hypothetical protein M2271_008301 [Streptomyces sp. LBL]|uniref:hypothetical protein n=1 Tax=Streptomyces sp. LBL TaxID=2940562 RepID=UPI0024743056|nr:hypothetical protein [Streptomyces sp. LBL]MDH6630441.1 hypothetical protein [Streptomyces sp. LBL]
MAQPIRIDQRYGAGDMWLANCHPHPARVWKSWHAGALASIASGAHWLVAETTVIHGMPAASRIREAARGPVLCDPHGDRAWWLVPLGAAEELADVPQVRVRHAGWMLRCPPGGRALERVHWLWQPDGSGHLTDPAVLASAFGPGGYRPLAEDRG